jgi:hypothetical protein
VIITAPAGTYAENINFRGKNITLQSADPTSAGAVAATIIDGNDLGACVTFAGTETGAVLDGFTITDGRGTSNKGGGIHGAGATGTVRRCVIHACEAVGSGAGGGMRDFDGTIQDNTIYDNTAGMSGGGLALCDGTITSNTIESNTALMGGGLAYCGGTIQYNLIAENSADTDEPWRGHGGGLFECDGTINHNTIVMNKAQYGGGLSRCNGTIKNSIIWWNSADNWFDYQVGDCATITYSIVMNRTEGTGSIQDAPEFTSWETGDWSLASGSPGEAAGDDGESMGK